MAIEGPIEPTGAIDVWLVDSATVYWRATDGSTIPVVRAELAGYRDAGQPAPDAATVTLVNAILAIDNASWTRGTPPGLVPTPGPSLNPLEEVDSTEWTSVTACDDGTADSDICPEPPWPIAFEEVDCEENCQ